jgi:hypothetical protein
MDSTFLRIIVAGKGSGRGAGLTYSVPLFYTSPYEPMSNLFDRCKQIGKSIAPTGTIRTIDFEGRDESNESNKGTVGAAGVLTGEGFLMRVILMEEPSVSDTVGFPGTVGGAKKTSKKTAKKTSKKTAKKTSKKTAKK